MLYYIILYSTIIYYIISHYTILYYTIEFEQRRRPPGRSMYVCMYVYIYIYIYIWHVYCILLYMSCNKNPNQDRTERARVESGCVRPVSILRSSLLRFGDSKLPGKFPMNLGIPPLNIQIRLESDPLKSIILVRRLAVRSIHNLRVWI